MLSCVAMLHRLARGDADLLLDDVDAGDLLGHGMLDLYARVHLHEVEAAVDIEKELDRAGVHVVDRADRLESRLAHRLSRISGVSAGEGASSMSF